MIHDAAIPAPFAWRADRIGGREGLTHRMSRAQVDAILALAERLDGRDPKTIRRDEFAHPAVDELMAAARDRVMDGHGAVILSGLDPSRFSIETFERLYWGLGTHLGRGVMQGPGGDYVGHVKVVPGAPFRGQTTDIELRSHTDFHEILSLATVSLGASGGVSGLASSLAIHEIMRAERPDLLAVLYEGIQQLSLRDRAPSEHKVPVFCARDGRVSCFYNRVFMAPPSEEQKAAFACFDAIAERPGVRADFTLEPGEMVFWNNFTVLHSRTAFEDSDTAKRVLLRLWLHVEDGPRPMDDRIRAMTRQIDEEHARQFALTGA